MTITKKLFIGIGITLASTLLSGFLAMHSLGVLSADLNRIASTSAHSLYLLGDINNATTDTQASMRNMMMRAHLGDRDGVQHAYGQLGEDMAKMRREDAEYLQLANKPELRDALREKVEDKLDMVAQLNATLYELILKGDVAGADAVFRTKADDAENTWSTDAEGIADRQFEDMKLRASEAEDSANSARDVSMLMIALSIGAGILLVWIVRQLTQALQSSIVELRDGADQVASAASQVSSSSQSLAQGASEQAASLEETSASSEEINSMARKNTDNSRSTAELLTQSQGKVTQANRHLDEMVISMNQITDSSGKISKIIKVIDEIAFQTNILALNAAVEAARAGEAGMGFAVVADEVRSLAQRSAQAAKDTATLIEDSIAKSNEGKGKVDQVAHAIQEVTQDTVRVKVMIDEVSLGSEEQSRGIDQIGRAISQMEQVTQNTAANAEQGAAAAEQLSAQSAAMKEIVNRLEVMVGGAGGGSSYRPPALASTRHAPRPSFNITPKLASPSTGSSAGRALPITMHADGGEGRSARKSAVAVDEFPMEESFRAF